jgi:preprotein translocase subunit SecA
MPQLTKADIKALQKNHTKAIKNFGGYNVKEVKRLTEHAAAVFNFEDSIAPLSDAELKAKTAEFKERLAAGQTLDDIMYEAYAVCREAAWRVLREKAFFVQIMGGIALHQGRIAQLSTGEGKTLMSTFPTYLNALAGQGVHVVTVNEYLAKRDAEWMGKIYKFLGLTVGVTTNRATAAAKRHAYNCDITYGTNNEYGFDYLRDNMAKYPEARAQRSLNFCIIDEVDSILIDEARTPLIISGPSGKSSDMYNVANRFVVTLSNSTNADNDGNLEKGVDANGDYIVNEKGKSVRLTDRGIEKAERFFNVDNLSAPDNIELNYYINNALRAHATMKRDSNYIVEHGKVVIVDEFTGRKMDGRRFNGGLHQAIEAKEHVTIKEENQTLATITFQNYFRLYKKMAGMTGTAKTEEEEFNTIYNIDVVVIPTNLPLARVDAPDIIYTTVAGKLRAIVERIKEVHQGGQPILVGTVTVEKSEQLSHLLTQSGVKHQVLNAKNHEREAEIVAQAGRLNAVTIATNMAGRGTDILLGGNAEFLAKHDMARQGYDEAQIELATSFADGDEEQRALQKTYQELLAKHKVDTNAEKELVKAAGGLFVLGTERHDSRRIDNQLRGRSGRQGDPGKSVFYMSAEDDMLRIFGEALQSTLRFLRVDENTPIESKLVSRQIENAQKSIEVRHFSARKNVLKFDDVNNLQRKLIYTERNKILDGSDIHADILSMADKYALNALKIAVDGNEKIDAWDFDEVNARLAKFYPIDNLPLLVEEDFNNAYEVKDFLVEHTQNILNQRYNTPVTADDGVSFADAEKYVLLTTIDRLWMQHLEDMDSLKDGIGLQSIGQHDPFMVFKQEGYKMFEELNDNIKIQTVTQLFFGTVKKSNHYPVKDASGNAAKSPNLPCPCGSGKKYKNCCMKKDLAAKFQAGADHNIDTPDRPLTKQEEYALKRQQRKAGK